MQLQHLPHLPLNETKRTMKRSNRIFGAAFERRKVEATMAYVNSTLRADNLSLRDMIALGNIPFSDVVAVRVSLMQLAIDLARERASEDDFARLDRNLDDLAATLELGDPRATIGPMMDFNRLIGRCAHNPVLELVVDTVVSLIEDVLEKLLVPAGVDLVGPRRQIVALMRARDADAAKAELVRHYGETTRFVLAYVDGTGAAPES